MFTKTIPFAIAHAALARALSLTVGLLLLISVNYGFAQSGNSSENTVFTVVEKQPEFPGGMRAFQDHLTANVRYPATADAAKVTGKVFVSLIIRDDGRITDVQVLKGIGFGCDQEAVRVISSMPSWTPGSQSGRPVNVKYNLVVPFGATNARSKDR